MHSTRHHTTTVPRWLTRSCWLRTCWTRWMRCWWVEAWPSPFSRSFTTWRCLPSSSSSSSLHSFPLPPFFSFYFSSFSFFFSSFIPLILLFFLFLLSISPCSSVLHKSALTVKLFINPVLFYIFCFYFKLCIICFKSLITKQNNSEKSDLCFFAISEHSLFAYYHFIVNIIVTKTSIFIISFHFFI